MKSKLMTLLLVGGLIVSGTATLPATSVQAQEEEKTEISIGVNPLREPIVEAAAPYLEEQGYTVTVETIADPIQLNEAVNEGSIDMNFQQHQAYMEQFNENRGGNLAVVGDKLYSQVVGLFSSQYDNLEDIPEGGQITIQNDPTNRDRALKLLEDAGLITLDEAASEPYELLDITENPKDLEFVEVSGEMLVRSLQDTDAAVLNGMNVAKAELNADDALAVYERDDADQYAVILATHADNVDTDWAQAVYQAFQTDEVIQAAAEVSNDTWIPAFETEESSASEESEATEETSASQASEESAE